MVATPTTHHGPERRRPSLIRVPAPPPTRAFDELLAAYQERGLLPPVALVVSVLDDVLLAHEDFGEGGPIELDAYGRAQAVAPTLSLSVGWLQLGLGEPAQWPAAAHALFAQIEATPPPDPPLLAAWIKAALGAPASHEELATVLREHPVEAPALISMPPTASTSTSGLSALAVDLAAPTADLAGSSPEVPPPTPPPAPISSAPAFAAETASVSGPVETAQRVVEPSTPPRAAAARAPSGLALDLAAPTADLDSGELPTLRPISQPAPIAEPIFEADDGLGLNTSEEGPLPVPEPVVDEADIPTDPPLRARPRPPSVPPASRIEETLKEDRAVVRHRSARERPVSLQMAPAARKSAQPLAGGESIILPAERRGSPWWLLLLALAGGAVYALFFR